jgi:hypothetical protein
MPGAPCQTCVMTDLSHLARPGTQIAVRVAPKASRKGPRGVSHRGTGGRSEGNQSVSGAESGFVKR